MAWVEKRAWGWVVCWRDDDGGRHAGISYDTKAEAIEAQRDLEERMPKKRARTRRGGVRPRAALTIAEIAKQWREWRRGTEKERRPGATDYGDQVERVAIAMAKELGWSSPKDANKHDVRAYRQRRANTGVDRPLAYLRLVLRWATAELDQPLDVGADRAMRAPQTAEADVGLLTDEDVSFVLAEAEKRGQWLLFDCLNLYGWRPSTAARLMPDDVLIGQAAIKIGIKHNGEPWIHPLHPRHIEPFSKLLDRACSGELLMRAPDGKPWVSGSRISLWYRNVKPPRSDVGNVYALKRKAITRMHAGEPPWARRLTIPEIQLYTGHRRKEMILRYLRTDLSHARSLFAPS